MNDQNKNVIFRTYDAVRRPALCVPLPQVCFNNNTGNLIITIRHHITGFVDLCQRPNLSSRLPLKTVDGSARFLRTTSVLYYVPPLLAGLALHLPH